MILLGTIVNALGIVAGAILGVLLTSLLAKNKKLAAIPDKLMKAVGLCVIYIGISGTFENKNTLVLILSMVIGALIGELIDIDKHLNTLGAFVERKLTTVSPSEILADSLMSRMKTRRPVCFCVPLSP